MRPIVIALKKTVCVLVYTFMWAGIQAQEIFTPPAAKMITSFRFEQLSGGVILIRGTLDGGKDSLNFVLDTGSGGISLDSTTAADLHLILTSSNRTLKGIAGVRNVEYAMHHTLHLPGVKTDSLNFHINDYSLLTAVYGLQIDGIIGYSVLSRYIVHIDYELGMVSFFTQGAYKYKRGGTLLRPAFNNLPIQTASVKDNTSVTQRFYLDTGGGLCLLFSEDFVRDSALFSPKKKMTTTVAEGMGGKKSMLITTLKELKLGPYKFKKVPAYIFEDEFNVTSYPMLGGLIGADVLRRFNITLNYKQREIHLLPNAHFRDHFDYSYTGMEIYYENGEGVVGEIMKDSPAEKAGLLVGDVIVSIDKVLSSSFQAFKAKLQNAGKTLQLIISRHKVLMEMKIKVASIR